MNTHPQSRFASFALAIGICAFAIGELLRQLVDSGNADSPVALTQAVSAHAGLWTTAGFTSLLVPVLMLPGLFRIIAEARGRGARVTRIGGWLVAIGLIASVGHLATYFIPPVQYAAAGSSATTITALYNASGQVPMFMAFIVCVMLGMVIGTVVLLVGLRRAHRAPIWAVVTAVVFAVSEFSVGLPSAVIGLLAAVATFIPVARSLTTVPNEVEPAAVHAHAAEIAA